jgi:hypothetical protein
MNQEWIALNGLTGTNKHQDKRTVRRRGNEMQTQKIRNE